MAQGKVKWFNGQKGFGFIVGDDGKEYFVHYTAMPQGTFLRENDIVSFDPNDNEKGPLAQNVALVKKGSEVDGESSGDEQPTDAPAEEQPSLEEPEESPEDKTEF